MSYVGSRLRHHDKHLARLERRLATAELPGKVVERDAQKRMVRLDLGKDPDTGETVKGPWVRVQSNSAGAVKSFVLPSIGEQMYLSSPSGIIGADSVARFGTFTTQNPHPTQEDGETVIFEVGDTRLSAVGGEIRMKAGGSTHTLNAQGTTLTGGKVKHEGKEIGSTHKHTNVQPGGGQSGPPV